MLQTDILECIHNLVAVGNCKLNKICKSAQETRFKYTIEKYEYKVLIF